MDRLRLSSRRDGQRLRPVTRRADFASLSLALERDAELLFRGRLEALVTIDQPMVLVSQLQRSGGTLLLGLLDGHPELFVHAYELKPLRDGQRAWPRLDLDAGADAWLEALREPGLARLFESGYRKKLKMNDLASWPTLPFTLVPSFLDRLVRALCEKRPLHTQRQVLDTYFTSYFNAWIDYEGLRATPKRWVAAFGPRLAWGESRADFHAAYPDGRVASVLRDPGGWYASARLFSGQYARLDEGLALWSRGAREIQAAKAQRPDQVFVTTFEALVVRTEDVMGALADWLGIAWSPSLLTPTFNRLPTVPNSSFGLTGHGVRHETHNRPDGDRVTVSCGLSEIYEEIRSVADVA
jgi:hypothetical protein